jgi:hypothetical protein
MVDRIHLGEMPPEGEKRPVAEEASVVTQWVNARLREAEREAKLVGGQHRMRRLNRQEYANTVGDLLGLDPHFVAKLKESLPADGKAEGFDRIGSALFVDQTQMEKYLESAEAISLQAIQSNAPKVRTHVWQAEASRRNAAPMVSLKSGGLSEGEKMIDSGPPYYTVTDDGFEVWGSNPFGTNPPDFINIPAGPAPDWTTTIVEDGYYRIRVFGWGFAGERGEPIQLHLRYAPDSPIEVQHVLDMVGTRDKPDVAEAVLFLRAGQAGQKTGLKIRWNGLGDVRVKNRELAPLLLQHLQVTKGIQKAKAARDEVEVARRSQELAQVIASLQAFDGPEYFYNEKYDINSVPRLFLDRIEIEGPIVQQWPPASHRLLGIEKAIPETESDVRSFFARLLPRAYRRPVDDEEVESLVRVVHDAREQHGMQVVESLRLGLVAMLSSPRFVFLDASIEDNLHAQQTKSRDSESVRAQRADNFLLASRLSYFLWSSLPDNPLFELAAAGKLSQPKILAEQVSRMLTDPKARRFVEGFAGQWLSVDQFGSVMPAKEYRDYDEELEMAAREEPLAFFQQVLNENHPITDFLDSDFLIINARLARHYGIEGIDGSNFRKVAIQPEHHRGGVLGMAGLLTLLSDGTRTLPVRRAAWVLENLLNDPPGPPPPNAGEIQPNTSGKNLSVRERLELHRNDPICASCHTKLDSYGLALENFDAIGAWRVKQNGEGIREGKAPLIDASGKLKSGRPFNDLASYKAALLEEKSKFARAFCEKLLIYALGRPVGLADRQTVDDLVATLDSSEYRIQSLIQAIVASEAFLTN